MGVYQEKHIPVWFGVLILLAAFLVLYQPWMLAGRELLKLEGYYAAQASEMTGVFSSVTAHGVAIQNAYPLYPMVVKALQSITGIGMDLALRLVSVLMLGIATLIVGVAAGSQRNHMAGFVASAMFLSTNLMVEKAQDGYPETMTLTLLLSAQLLFFYYGVRKSSWDKAWIAGALFLSLAFLSGGFMAIVYFIFPLFFLRRPLSVRSKFEKPGFAVGVAILVIAVLFWTVPYFRLSEAVSLQYLFWDQQSVTDYLLDVAAFPFDLMIRLLPWSLIAWLPFCVALQSLDETPIYSRYLRTLTFASLGLIWLLPDTASREMVFLLAPLSILTGMTYPLGMRRYGYKLRKIMPFLGWLCAIPAVGIMVFIFAPRPWLEPFMSLRNSIEFRNSMEYWLTGVLASLLILLIAAVFYRGRVRGPVWLMLLALSISGGIFYWQVMHPYRSQSDEKRVLGNRLKSLLPNGEITLYKHSIGDLYCELYYAGAKVRKISDFSELPPSEQTVYLVSTQFPQFPDRAWSNLLAPDYMYRGHRLCLWKGELRHDIRKNAKQ